MLPVRFVPLALCLGCCAAQAAPGLSGPLSPANPVDRRAADIRTAHSLESAPEGTLSVSVGSDAACDYENIQQAAFFAPAATDLRIRVARNVVLTAPQLLPARDITLLGGYNTCDDTMPEGFTSLDGSGFTGSVLWASASFSGTESYRIRVFNIGITGGTGNTSARGGGITIDGPFDVWLIHSAVIESSTTYDGGGLLILGEAGTATGADRTSLLVTAGSVISANNAGGSGGGIHCSGRVRIDLDDAQIAGNSAVTSGGGIHSEGCRITSFDHGPSQGIVNNRVSGANGVGGGIAATGGLVAIGGDSRKSPVSLNQASWGGGLFVDAATLLIYDGTVTDNTAIDGGGGIYAVNTATYIERNLPGASCHDALRCSELSRNRVLGSSPGTGGALLAFGGWTWITGTFIEDNEAASGRGMAVHVQNATGPSGTDGLQIIGSVVAGNNAGVGSADLDSSIIYLPDSSGAVGFTTIAGNLGVPRIIHTPTSHPVTIYGTIFDASFGYAADSGASGTVPFGDCNRLNETSSAFAAASARSTTAAPGFNDPATGDWGLSATSEMIEWCDASYALKPDQLSADGGPRPYNDPSWGALYGNYDLGGLERHPDDRIFADGFEQ